MGYTLHAHIEVKLDGKWQHFAAPVVDRNYLLFAVMAGVRKEDMNEELGYLDPSEITTIPWKKEIPDNISDVTRVCHTKESEIYNLHHEGWIDRPDIRMLQAELNRYVGLGDKFGPFDLEDDIFHTYINCGSLVACSGFDDVRIIFWFDN